MAVTPKIKSPKGSLIEIVESEINREIENCLDQAFDTARTTKEKTDVIATPKFREVCATRVGTAPLQRLPNSDLILLFRRNADKKEYQTLFCHLPVERLLLLVEKMMASMDSASLLQALAQNNPKKFARLVCQMGEKNGMTWADTCFIEGAKVVERLGAIVAELKIIAPDYHRRITHLAYDKTRWPALQKVDKDGDGVLSLEEVESYLALRPAEKIPEKERDTLLDILAEEITKDGNGGAAVLIFTKLPEDLQTLFKERIEVKPEE